MGSTSAQSLTLALLIASMLGGSMAYKGWGWGQGYNYSHWGHGHVYRHPNSTQGPNRINVGDSENWHFGFNYTKWAINHGPFYLNDILVFKYDPPSSNNTHPHSIYMLPDLASFVNCNFSQARMLASTTQGADEGFEFKLKSWQPYYFACGESNGYHCSNGGMKFLVVPVLRGWNF
ncbi:hypothetical protein FEM48_Zijuj09G0117900 [Ziziphus jujuba var. spinosa]|uniref:Phytocyanin domain-containing protein n=1 Tax=Ziziphus jujuba var. spinosa TaxID=714518 RepID=A0A978USU3_ZIZJJ|nr:hypothetical protein FEM48_Zijuj09G0117900 [Ziziphus jujuba var. spinosa]